MQSATLPHNAANAHRLRAGLLLLCCLAGLVGAGDLAGWWLHRQAFTRFFSGYALMKPNTAFLILLLSVAAWLKRQTGRSATFGTAVCWVVIALTTATLFEYSTGHNLGIDQLLAYAPVDAGGDPAGRMAVGTAICALLLSAGLVVLDTVDWLSRLLVAASGLISLSALVGYAFDAGPLKGVPLLRSMAAGTAEALFAIHLATLLLRPEREPIYSLLHTFRLRGASAFFVFGTCLLPFAIGLPVAYLYRHGLIDATFSFALLIVLLIVLQAILISRNNRSVAQLEEKRASLEQARTQLAAENELNHAEALANARRAVQSEGLYRLISDAVPAYIAYIDRDFRYVRANRTYRDWFNKTAAEIDGRPIEEVLGSSADGVRPYLEASLAGVPQQFEVPVQTARGERILSISHTPDLDEQGNVRGVVVQGFDNTESRQVEQMLRLKGERLSAAQMASDLAAWEWNLGTYQVTWDEDSTLLYGRPLSELADMRALLKFVHPEDRNAVRDALQPAREGKGEFNFEYRVVWPDESVHWILGRGRPFFDAEGKPVRVAGVNMDTTLRRQTEIALRQNEKLAAVGRLASTIAHELNNPLESVTNLLYLALGSEEQEEVRGYLKTAESELRRASAIASQTLKFHRQATRPTQVVPEDLLENVLGLHGSRLQNAGVTVECRIKAGAAILCFEGEIQQVLHNLIGNAIDAMPSGGRLIIASRAGHNWSNGKCGVAITLADTGIGIPASTLRKLFTPFFTTKGISGTGLGLWVSREIAERHGGTLKVRSRQGAGTVFRIFLPSEAAARN